MVAAGYFRELQLRGLSLRMMTRRLGKSLRTVATLSKRASGEVEPLEGSRRIGLRRRIFRDLSERGERTLDEVRAAMTGARSEDVIDELEQLASEGVIEREGERWRPATGHLDLARADLDHRLESLRHFLGAVSQVVYRRFFEAPTDAEAFARVFTFSATPAELGEIRRSVYDSLRAAVVAADAASEGKPDAIQASATVSFVETPTDLAWKPRAR
jgi:hypothetical protein